MSCERCELLEELYERTPKSDRDYWLMTELFVMLHGGVDFCLDSKVEPGKGKVDGSPFQNDS